ncbi:MAG: ComF family protein [Clostridia bacterium]|nr:ComF family protein [Clostridia bacterium]
MKRTLGQWMTSLIFPMRCCLCGEVVAWSEHLCARCRQEAPYILPPVCERCGCHEDDCTCGGHHRHFARCVAPFRREGVVQDAINRLKKDSWATDTRGLAVEMAEVLRREYGGIAFDVVTDVPTHKKEYRRRGHNDAEQLARAISSLIRVPYYPLLRKIIHTRPQKELNALERTGNLLGAFDVIDEDRVKGKTVLLVDDVITTGSTLDECAKMLKIYDAAEVYVVTVAAVVLPKQKK